MKLYNFYKRFILCRQSAIQELLISEQLRGQPNRHILPTCDEYDIGNYNFKLNIPTQINKGAGWKYSEVLNKVYIRMNDILTVEAIYTPQFPVQQLRIRTFICFAKEVSEPVLRCQNHLSKDCEQQSTKRESLLRCENPNAEYFGTADGKSIQERYSISVPLSLSTIQDNKTVKQTIALKFTCQNSCVGRKETCIIFILENTNGEIYSQRVLNVRVCSCPKRDKNIDEKNFAVKRKSEDDIFLPESKVRKHDLDSSPIIKEEDSNSDYENNTKNFDVQRTASGSYRLVVELSSKQLLLAAIDYMYAKECVNVYDGSKEAERAKQHIRKLKKLRNISEKLYEDKKKAKFK